MKKKFIIFTLCFTLIFSSLNYKKSYADGGVISLPILATVSSLAVGTGIVLNSNDDLLDIGRIFYDYVHNHNSLTWQTVQGVFAASVSVLPNKLVSVQSPFLDIVKEFFDTTFNTESEIVGTNLGLPYYYAGSYGSSIRDFGINYGLKVTISDSNSPSFSVGHLLFERNGSYNGNPRFSIYRGGEYLGYFIAKYGTGYDYYFYALNYIGTLKPIVYTCDKKSASYYDDVILETFNSVSATLPYVPGSYNWDNVDSKTNDDKSISLPVPGDLGSLVGQGSKEFWDNADNLVGSNDLTLPNIDTPSIGLEGDVSFPGSISPDVPESDSPSVPNDGIWSTIKDFIISLVVPNDAFWTDTWGGLYNNFTDSFPMVDMSGFNDLVAGEKKFPNIDINIMGITGRVVNGDVINSIVDWLRPIIAGFMMICLMLFNYRKIYKLIRNTEPFGGIAPGTSDFKTGISEYTHVGLVNDGFKRSEEEEFARSRYYEDMYFRNGGKL